LASRLAGARGIAEIIIGKDRHGPGGTVKVHWNPERMRFENLAKSP
jgi:replicative DNA helicase